MLVGADTSGSYFPQRIDSGLRLALLPAQLPFRNQAHNVSFKRKSDQRT